MDWGFIRDLCDGNWDFYADFESDVFFCLIFFRVDRALSGLKA